MKKQKTVRVVHTRAQKIWGFLALAGLFLCGIMVGLGINGRPVPVATNAVADTSAVVTDAPAETCEIIEEILMRDLMPVDSDYVPNHEFNITVYEKLIMNGCSENQMKYHKLAQQERDIVNALQQNTTAQQTCEQIESLLIGDMPSANGNSRDRIWRAKIYANLSERGCPENSAKYVEMAARELEIARALEDDEFDNQETVEVVETYKRLNMQAAAEQVFDMAKRLTNPTIDFILEVEKIINAQ